MKNKLIYLFSIMLCLSVVGAAFIHIVSKNSEYDDTKDGAINIVTSFYPMYIIGLNLTDGIDEFHIRSLTSNNIGCLHDYQLTTQDMKMISAADIFMMNGGGMESFMEDVISNYPDLYTMNISEGIPMIKESDNSITGHAADKHSGDDHSDQEYNAHVWLNPQLYMKQIENASDGLVSYVINNPEYNQQQRKDITQRIEENARIYLDKIIDLDKELENTLHLNSKQVNINKEGVVIFHDAFAYLANRIGLTVARSIEIEADTQLSAKEIADIVDQIKANKIQYLFTEVQYGDTIAERIKAETNVSVHVIDSAVTGDNTKDSYINSMKNNIEVLKEALQ